MSTTTGKTLNLVKPELTDDHKVTIGTDLPANFQKIDDEFSAHWADTVTDIGGVHGLEIEEGNWTPFLLGEINAGTWTASTYNKGKYYKIGKQVFCNFLIHGTLASAVGNLCMGGLPFPPSDSIVFSGFTTSGDVSAGFLKLANNGVAAQPRFYNAASSAIDSASLSGEIYVNGVFEFRT